MSYKKIKSKKAQIFNYALALITFSLLLYAFFALTSRSSDLRDIKIGASSYEIISNQQKNQKSLFYTQQLIQQSQEEIINELFEDAGFYLASPCGSYYGYNLLNNQYKECFPNYADGFAAQINRKLNTLTNNPSWVSDITEYSDLGTILNDVFDSPELSKQPEYFVSVVNEGKSVLLLPKKSKIYSSSVPGIYGGTEIKSEYLSTNKVDLDYNLNILSDTISESKDLIATCTPTYNNLLCIYNWLANNPEWEYKIPPSLLSGYYGSIDQNKHLFVVNKNNLEIKFVLYIESDPTQPNNYPTRVIPAGTQFTFPDSNGNTHTLTVNNINTNQQTASITINSEPIDLELSLNQEEVLDITGDGTYDIYLILDEIGGDENITLTFVVFEKPKEFIYLLGDLVNSQSSSQNPQTNPLIFGFDDSDPISLSLNIIKEMEGFDNDLRPLDEVSHPYICPAGKLTVGYGHVIISGEDYNGGLTEPQASALLLQELSEDYYPQMLNHLESKGLTEEDFTNNQLAAILSFVYNLGVGTIDTASWPQKFKENKVTDAEISWKAHHNANSCPLPGLVRRRFMEWQLFQTGSYIAQPEGWQEYYNAELTSKPECS